MKKHFANLVTLLRIIGVSLIFIWTPFKNVEHQQLVLLIYIVLASTDCLDGVVARSRWGQITRLGKILDPMADKILVLVYLPLLEMHQITSFPVFILLARDIVITTLRIFASQVGEIIAAKLSGKIRTIISLTLAGILFARIKSPNNNYSVFLETPIKWVQSWPQYLITALIWLLIISTLISAIEYLYKFFAEEKHRKALFTD